MMRIRAESATAVEEQANVVVFVSEENGLEAAGRPLALAGRIAALRERGDFRGKRGATCLLYEPRGAGQPDRRWLLAGLGSSAQRGPRAWRAAAAAAQCALAELGAESALVVLPPAADLGELAAGLLLSGYKYDRYLKNGEARAKHLNEAVLLLAPDAEPAAAAAALARAARHAEGVALARELMNGPANAVTPRALADAAQAIAAAAGGTVACRVLEEAELAAENCRAILAVGAGSAEPSRLIILDYAPAGATRTVVLVGKGVTFDSGGISIKPAADMHEMKWDMGP
ncbi:leucyl aminopeptidase, partial [bacterium]|nr:leucyl aminopeptidase [bacterium]